MKCCDMHAGMLKEPIEIQEKTRTPDGSGGFTEVWAEISGAPDMAAVKAASGFEKVKDQRVQEVPVLKATIRYFAGIEGADRAVIRSRNYNIGFVNNLEFADRWVTLTLTGGVAQ